LDSGYRIEVAPLFVKGLSAGDIIDVEGFEDGSVKKWTHLHRSPRSTAWLIVRNGSDPEPALECLKRRKCNIVSFPPRLLFSIDIPETCSLEEFDACLNLLAEEDRIGLVFPSLRHRSHPRAGERNT
jgi:Domain of unknown function (DUF4265)